MRNDASVVEAVLAGWRPVLAGLPQRHEVIAIDDASSDSTAELVERQAASWPELRLVRHASSKGIGGCLKSGIAAASNPLLAYADCSLAYRPEDLLLLLGQIDQVHLVSGKRSWSGRWPTWAERDWLHCLRSRFIFGVRLSDVDCCFKLLRRQIFIRIPIQSSSDLVHAEIVAKANFRGHLMTELPIRYEAGRAAPARWRDAKKRGKEARQLFADPDFGPPFIEQATA